MRIVALLVMMVWIAPLTAQDNKAQTILNDLSKKMKAYKSFYLELKASIKNPDTGVNKNVTGKGWVQGDKFHTVYGDNTIMSNGIKVWVVSKEDKAVYVSSATDDDEETLNPKKLMSIWENGFNNKYIKEEAGSHVIHLFPKNPGKSDYHTIVLKVGVAGKDIKAVEIRLKDGTKMVYEVIKFDGDPEIPSSKFVYDKRNYPGYQEVDN